MNMKNVTYYNAGAGSGKTYTLIEKLANLIVEGKAKPQEMILTTFTKKAAAEFREKAKACLYEAGRFEEALQIDNAMIGDVHSVCKHMIDKYWYLLGLSPNTGVMDEESKKFYMSQSLSGLTTKEEDRILIDFAYTFEMPIEDGYLRYGIDPGFWRKHLHDVIDFATNYEITDFRRSEEESLKFLEQFVDHKGGNVTITDEELNDMIQEATESVVKNNRIKAKEPYYAKFNDVKAGRNNKNIAWLLNAVKVLEKKYGDSCETVGERMKRIWFSPKVFEAQKEYIHTLFTIAARWQKQYAEYKRDKNVIDYNDMEYYMLQLLQKEESRGDIAQSYRYLFVDEFQDSSPIQIKLFSEMSKLMTHSFWVGDFKQSIYGFRGTDIDMVKAVTESIDKENIIKLGESHRSLPPIVKVCNHLFTRLFEGKLNPEEICLEPHRGDDHDLASLRFYLSEGKNVDVQCVTKLLHSGVAPKDIAVLARTNAELKSISGSLQELGVASCLQKQELTSQKTWQLLEALLRLADNPYNMLARAKVAMLTDSRYGIREIVESRLERGVGDKEFLTDVSLIGKLIDMRDDMRTLSVAALLEQMIIELGLYQTVKQVESNSIIGNDCLHTAISAAKKYEEYCLQMNMPASINGFIQYAEEVKPKTFGNPDGVQLFTYHGSKGLQWKYVILTSLDSDVGSASDFALKNIYGARFERSEAPSKQNPNPEVYIRLTPWLFGTGKSVPASVDEPLRNTETYKNTLTSEREEMCRLLYVGMTRPRDVMILNINKTEDGSPDLTLFQELKYADIGGKGPENGCWDIFSTGDIFVNFTPTEEEIERLSALMGTEEFMLDLSHINLSDKQEGRRYISPSGVNGTMQIGKIHDFHYRLGMEGNNSDMAQVGNCIHHIFASIEDMQLDDGCTAISYIIRSYGLEDILMGPECIATAWNNLTSHLTTTYGAAVRTWHERPFRMERDGQTIVGSIDLVWQTSEGDILIDYKTNPQGVSVVTDPASEHYAGHYGGQLATYREALEAAGENVLKTLVYYPVSGLLVEIEK